MVGPAPAPYNLAFLFLVLMCSACAEYTRSTCSCPTIDCCPVTGPGHETRSDSSEIGEHETNGNTGRNRGREASTASARAQTIVATDPVTGAGAGASDSDSVAPFRGAEGSGHRGLCRAGAQQLGFNCGNRGTHEKESQATSALGHGLTLELLILGTIGLATLLWRIGVAKAAARQSYYVHLSDVWYSLRDAERSHPEWLDLEATTMYGLNHARMPHTPEAYDAHAWKSWAMVEDWYVAFKREIDPDGAKGRIARTKRRVLRWLSRGSVLHQFEGALRSVVELHWAWLDVPRNSGEFDIDFLEWLARNYYYDRVESVGGTPIGRALQLKEGVELVRAGQFLGGLRGTVHGTPAKHTIQLGPDLHLLLEEPLRSLNHSNNPNALVLGRSLVAGRDIEPSRPGKPTQITIDYNATEYLLSDPFLADGLWVKGWSTLSRERREEIYPRTHRWLR